MRYAHMGFYIANAGLSWGRKILYAYDLDMLLNGYNRRENIPYIFIAAGVSTFVTISLIFLFNKVIEVFQPFMTDFRKVF